MSDPQPAKIKPTPPRAEPLQPDLPGRGSGEANSPKGVDIEDPAVTRGTAGESSVAEESQEENALKNVSEGYK